VLQEYETHKEQLVAMGITLRDWREYEDDVRAMKLKHAMNRAQMKGV